MNIVILDAHTANPGDLSWEALERQGSLTVHERSSRDEVVPRARGAELVLTNKTVLDRELLSQLPALRYVGVLATGYNVVDGAALAERRIPLCNVPAYGTSSVAQQTIALLLELTNRCGRHSDTVREGAWASSKDFCYWNHPLVELSGLTLGIVGYGAIGEAVARIADAFGMKLLGYSRSPKKTALPVRFVDLETLVSESDVVSLHCPLNDDTRGMVNATFLKRMKKTAFLLNTSRGPLIVEQDLADALDGGMLAGAGLDVLSSEPPARDNPLPSARNCLITPHIAWATRAARARLIEVAAENVGAFLAGKTRNAVNGVV